MSSFERGIQTGIIEEAVHVYGTRIWIRVKHGSTYAVVGDPDIYGCLDGLLFAFEVKNEDGRLTAIQRHRLKEIIQAGGNAAGVRSVQEAMALLKEWRRT